MIIFMGVAGVGKSVQGHMLAEERGYQWVSSGELFRKYITGKRREEMLAGKLMTDDELMSLVDKVFNTMDLRKEFVLDGTPRTIGQADWLIDQAKQGRFSITAVINLKASEQVVVQRMLQRGRQDDTEDAIRTRFEEYERQTKPIIEHLKKAGIRVDEINGEQTPEAVHKAIVERLG